MRLGLRTKLVCAKPGHLKPARQGCGHKHGLD